MTLYMRQILFASLFFGELLAAQSSQSIPAASATGISNANAEANSVANTTPTAQGLSMPWHPNHASMALNLTALNGTGVGLITWHSDTYSEEDQITLNGGHNDWARTSYVPNTTSKANGSTSDWNLSITSLMRWRICPLRRFADLNLIVGPYASYAHDQYFENGNNPLQSPPNREGGYSTDAYSLGLKTGVDVELFFLEGWSLQLGYLVSGAWSSSYETIGYSNRSDSNFSYTGWSYGNGAAQAGLNYYFR